MNPLARKYLEYRKSGRKILSPKELAQKNYIEVTAITKQKFDILTARNNDYFDGDERAILKNFGDILEAANKFQLLSPDDILRLKQHRLLAQRIKSSMTRSVIGLSTWG